jgi:hypothetical protein
VSFGLTPFIALLSFHLHLHHLEVFSPTHSVFFSFFLPASVNICFSTPSPRRISGKHMMTAQVISGSPGTLRVHSYIFALRQVHIGYFGPHVHFEGWAYSNFTISDGAFQFCH